MREGGLPLPIGSSVQLGQVEAVVKQVTLLEPTSTVGAQLALECEVPQEWWDAHAED